MGKHKSGMINHVSAGLRCSQSTCVYSVSLDDSDLGGGRGYQSGLSIASNRNQFWVA